MTTLFDQLPLWQQERDRAMSQVADNAEAARPGFADEAGDFVTGYLERHGPSSGEAITNACKESGIVPHDDRAFGPVYQRLSSRGLIRKVGHAPRQKGHGTSGGNVWALSGIQ